MLKELLADLLTYRASTCPGRPAWTRRCQQHLQRTCCPWS